MLVSIVVVLGFDSFAVLKPGGAFWDQRHAFVVAIEKGRTGLHWICSAHSLQLREGWLAWRLSHRHELC